MGNLCGTCGTAFLSKQHRWQPPSSNPWLAAKHTHWWDFLKRKPATKSFQENVTTLSPMPLEIAVCFHEGETRLTYVADPKKQATHCNFGANLIKALWDRLVSGLLNVQIQIKCLLSEAKLKYSALEIAVAMGTATHDDSELQSEFHPEQSQGLK